MEQNEKVVFQEWTPTNMKVFVWLEGNEGTTELGELSKMGSLTGGKPIWWFEPKYEAGFIMNSSDLLQIAAKLDELNKSEQERAHPC